MRSVCDRIGSYVLAACAVVLVWAAASWVLASPALPSPYNTLSVVGTYMPEIVPAAVISLWRVVASLLIAACLGAPLGLVLGRCSRANAIVGPVLQILYPIPKVALLPVLLVLLGLGDEPKIALMALTVFFQVAVSVRDAAQLVSPQAIMSVQSLGASRLDVMWHVVVPACLSPLFSALRTGSATAVSILFFSEAIAGSSGLGYFIVDSWSRIDYPRMFAGIVALAVLGVAVYEALWGLERFVASQGRRQHA